MKAFIFDMDGTILDTEKIYYKTWLEIGKKRNFYFDIDTKLQLNGLSYDESIKKMMDLFRMDKKTAISVRKELNDLRDDYFNDMNTSLKKEGLVEFLDFLKKENKKIALASSSPRKRIDFLLEKEGIRDYFEIVISGDEIKNGKPNPEIFEKTMELLQVSPDESYIIEDSYAGILAANRAKGKSVLIPDLDNTDKLKEISSYVFPNFLTFKKFLENEGKNRGKTFKTKCPSCKNDMELFLETAFLKKDFNNDNVFDKDFSKILCPKCKREFIFNYPFTYTNRDQKFMLVNDPRFEKKVNRLAFKASLKILDKSSKDNLSDFSIRMCVDIKEIREKIAIFENGLDDRLIEIMKVILFETMKSERNNEEVKKIIYQKNHKFLILTKDKSMQMDFVDSLYESLEEKYALYFDKFEFKLIDSFWARNFMKEVL